VKINLPAGISNSIWVVGRKSAADLAAEGLGCNRSVTWAGLDRGRLPSEIKGIGRSIHFLNVPLQSFSGEPAPIPGGDLHLRLKGYQEEAKRFVFYRLVWYIFLTC